MKPFKDFVAEAIRSDGSGRGFKNKDVASKGGQTAGRNKRNAAGSKIQDGMIDAAIKQDKKAFDKLAKQWATYMSKILGHKPKPQKMWSAEKAKAKKDGSYWK